MDWGYHMFRSRTAIAVAAVLAIASQQPFAAPAASGMVSSAHPLATEAGLEVLRAGGNAFDAAVAVAAALNVVEPAMSGAGGYGTIVLHHAESQETWFLNPSGRIPAGVDSDAFRAPTPGYLENRKGAKSVSTPGNVNAWEAMSKKYGRLKWRQLFEPAIRLAAEGYVLEGRDANLLSAGFGGFPQHAKEIYGKDGKPLARGDRLEQKDLARSLRLIADGGADVFYRGELAKAIDGEMRAARGFLGARRPRGGPRRMAEADHPSIPRCRRRHGVPSGECIRLPRPPRHHEPFRQSCRPDTIPSSICTASPRRPSTASGSASGMPATPTSRLRRLARLLSTEYFREQAAAIDPARRRNRSCRQGGGRGRRKHPRRAKGVDYASTAHTTHFVVADRWGNVVSATQTLGGRFGSRIMPRGTGIWLNDSLEFSTFEPKGNPMDAHAGRRKLSGDCPTIIMRNGRPWVALGTPGGHTIGQTVPQMVMNLVDFGMDVQQSIAAPRISFSQPDTLPVEEPSAKTSGAHSKRRVTSSEAFARLATPMR